MAKISLLPRIPTGEADGTELLPVVREGTTMAAPVADFISPAAQPFVDAAESAAATAMAAANYHPTIAEAIEQVEPGAYFTSDDKAGVTAHAGELRTYLRTVAAPYYADQGDAAAPATKAGLNRKVETLDLNASDPGKGASMVGDGSGATVQDHLITYTFEQLGVYGVGVAAGAESGAINDAIALARLTGGVIRCTPGKTYLIDAPINLTDIAASQNPVKIINEGARGAFYGLHTVTFKRAPGYKGVLFTQTGRGVELHGITIDGDNMPGHLLVISRGFEPSFYSCRFINAIGYAILGRALSNATFHDTFVDQCAYTNTCADMLMAANSATATSASASFDQHDIGCIIRVPGAGPDGVDLMTSILSVVDAHTVVLRKVAGTAVAGASARWDAPAVLLTGNSSHEYVTNRPLIHNMHIERSRGIALALGWGDDVDSFCEFPVINGLHVEATSAGGTAGVITDRPQVIIGNVRGGMMLAPFLYGTGTPIYYEKFRDSGLSAMHGFTIVAPKFLGYLESHAIVLGKTPDFLVDCVTGDQLNLIGPMFDTAMVCHVNIRSTFGGEVHINGPTHITRTGACQEADWIHDARTDSEDRRKGASIYGILCTGLFKVYRRGIASLARISSDAGVATLLIWQRRDSGGTFRDRWRIGMNAGSDDLVINRRSATGTDLGSILSVRADNGVVSLQPSIPTRAGAWSDANFAATPGNGTVGGIDETTDCLMIRSGNRWLKFQGTAV